MQLYLVRHGKPDYETDTLLPEGREQARQTAGRLSRYGISAIYSSPMGRAKETAQPLADMLGLPVQIEPWAYELGAETQTRWPDGEKKRLIRISSTHFLQPAYRKLNDEEALEQVDGFTDSELPRRYRELSEGLDGLLARHGYERTKEGFYLPVRPNGDKIALFCHCGMTRVLLSHMLHIPFQYVMTVFFGSHAGITLVEFNPDVTGPLVPDLRSYGDIGHLENSVPEIIRKPDVIYP